MTFFHRNLHDHGQPFSKTARLTCSYLYDFTWTVGTCTFSVQKVVGPKADQPDHFYIIMPLFMQHKSHQLPAPMHLKYKLITPTHYTYSQHLIPNVHLSVCKIIRNPTEYSPDIIYQVWWSSQNYSRLVAPFVLHFFYQNTEDVIVHDIDYRSVYGMVTFTPFYWFHTFCILLHKPSQLLK